MGKPKIAVIGCGNWGKNLVRVFSELGYLFAKCDKKFEEEVGGRYFHYKNCVTSDFVDAVAIATPSETHYEIAKAALEAGKDVFVEKPMCLRARDAYDLVEIAEKKQAILMVGHVLLYDPVIQDLKRGLDKLGKIQHIFATRLNNGRIRENESVWWSFAPHDVALVLNIMGDTPTRCEVQGDKNCCQTILSFTEKRKAYIQVSWLYPYKVHKMAVLGEKECFVYAGDWAVRRQGPGAFKEPLRLECQHFIDCIVSRGKPLTDGMAGLNVVRVLENCAHEMEGR